MTTMFKLSSYGLLVAIGFATGYSAAHGGEVRAGRQGIPAGR